MYPYILTEQTLTVVFDDGPNIIHKSDSQWENCLELLAAKDWSKLRAEMNIECSVRSYLKKMGENRITIEDGRVLYNGEVVDNYVVKKILEFREDGFDIEPLVNFLHRLMQNPSKHCIEKLYRFLEHGNMPVDKDGYFYAYKVVQSDYTDKHTGTIRNRPGDVVEMNRDQVDDDSAISCSRGLHAGSIQYIKWFGQEDDIIVIVKIDPRDVVTVPNHDETKLRCCKYAVVQKYEKLLRNTYYDYENTVTNEEISCTYETEENLGFETSVDPNETVSSNNHTDLMSNRCSVCNRFKKKGDSCICQNDNSYNFHSIRCSACGRFKKADTACICES